MKDWRVYTQETMAKLGIKPSKKLGQHFLTRYKIVNDMVNLSNITEKDHVLEIGGGFGILSEAILAKTKNLTIIEKDPKLANHLKSKFPNVNVILADALLVEWEGVTKVVSNLPYSISSAIIQKILHSNIISATVMIQKEVGERCVSTPGKKNYSLLSILSNIHSKPKKLFTISPDCFYPQPKVTSVIIQFEIQLMETNNDHEELELFAKNLFSLKRRTLRSVLRGFLKRKMNEEIWELAPFKEKRITDLSISNIDEVLTFLKHKKGWPFK